jgi:hypothetical protein
MGIVAVLQKESRSARMESKEQKEDQSPMAEHHPFKWHHFQAELILLCVRWYETIQFRVLVLLFYPLS